jgi:signal transduction histidine kinase/streptogramin lyase
MIRRNRIRLGEYVVWSSTWSFIPMNALKGRSTDRGMTLRRVILTIAALLAVCCPLSAQNQNLWQMLHTSWLGRDGAPQDINALAQTPDGVLWIGATGGLFSFDGIAFRSFQPKPGDKPLPFSSISSLVVSKNGDLWVEGIYNASIVRISNGKVTIFDHIAGSGCCAFDDLQEDADGTMWAILNATEIVRLGSDSIWHQSPTPQSPLKLVSSMYFDSLGTQWVIQDKQLYRRPRGQTRFISNDGVPSLIARMKEDRERRIWMFGRHHSADVEMRGAINIATADSSDRRTIPSSLLGLQINDLIETPDSQLWLAIRGKGIAHLRVASSYSNKSSAPNSAIEFYAADQGLTSDNPTVIYPDATGNIWVGGARGLDRFSPAALVPAIENAEEGAWSVCTNPAGEVWIASEKGNLWVLKGNRQQHIYKAQAIYKLYCGRKGDIWFIDGIGIMHESNGHFERLPPLPENALDPDRYSKFVSLSEFDDQELVASEEYTFNNSVWIFRAGKWKWVLPKGGPGTVTALLTHGKTLYFADVTGVMTQLEDSVVRTYVTKPTSIGVVATLSATSDGVFAEGDRGIAVLRGTYFQMLSFAQPEMAHTVSGLVEGADGDYWINGSRGIVRIASHEMTMALKKPSHKIFAEEIHQGDFVGPATWWKPNPSATVSTTGTLWFSTLNGVVSLNPESLKQSSNPPQLSIRSITADGQGLSNNLFVSAQAHALSIQYFGVDLTEPESVVYRYRLDGFDSSWQDVGHRSEATYTNLKPGVYTFRVMASNGDGRWTSPVSSQSITVLPHYYQTWWFDTFCALVAICLIWSLLTVRVRASTESIRIRADERAEERIRIAGELHDTLLQGVQGLLLSFHVLMQRLAADDELKPRLERALAMAEQITVEGRNRVTGLRSESLSGSELLESLERICIDLSVGTKIRCGVLQTGLPLILREQIADEMFNIGREALTNAVRHSQASNIELHLGYEKGSFTISCRDDGCGFDAAEFREQPRANHWGLRGIAERAERVGGTFTCQSVPTKGTTVKVTIPRSRAYLRPPGIFSFISLLK